eukprot:g7371.t1
MRVAFNITIVDVRCLDVSLDYQNVMGVRSVDVKKNVRKIRLHSATLRPVHGAAVLQNDVDDNRFEDLLDPDYPGIHHRRQGTNETCGDCYGALPSSECCDTCEDVIHAYRLKRWALPRIEQLEQCRGSKASEAYSPSVQVPVKRWTAAGTPTADGGKRTSDSRMVSSSLSVRGFQRFGDLHTTLPFGLGDHSSLGLMGPMGDGASPNRDRLWAAAEGKKWPDCVVKNTMIVSEDEIEKTPPTANLVELKPFLDAEVQKLKAAGVLKDLRPLLFPLGNLMAGALGASGSGTAADRKDKSDVPKVATTPEAPPAFELKGCSSPSSSSSKEDKASPSKGDEATSDKNCEATSTFACRVEEVCALVCQKTRDCNFWRHGYHARTLALTCWLHPDNKKNVWRLGFSSAPKNCVPGKAAGSGVEGSAPSTTTTTSAHPPAHDSQVEDEASAPRRKLRELSGRSIGLQDHQQREQHGESCRIFGHYETAKVPGNFHVNYKPNFRLLASGWQAGTFSSAKTDPGENVSETRIAPGSHAIHYLRFTELDSRTGEEIKPRTRGLLVPDTSRAGGDGDAERDENYTSARSRILHSNLGIQSFYQAQKPMQESDSAAVRLSRLLLDEAEGVGSQTAEGVSETKDPWSPLDGTAMLNYGFANKTQASIRYYLEVIPNTHTERRGKKQHRKNSFQYHTAGGFHTSGVFDGGVYFRYEVDPIRVVYFEKEVPWTKFLTNLCAIVGGVVGTAQFLFATRVRT